MLKVDNIDIEYPQISKEPKMGYADEYIEKTMISGLIKRIYRGKRFYATFSYPFLLPEQISTINQLLSAQRQKGYLSVEISSPFGGYVGQAILELNQDQTRFKYSKEIDDWVWTNWKLNVKATAYDN